MKKTTKKTTTVKETFDENENLVSKETVTEEVTTVESADSPSITPFTWPNTIITNANL